MTDLKNKGFPEEHFETLDVTVSDFTNNNLIKHANLKDRANTEKLIHNFRPDTIIHNAAILSGKHKIQSQLQLISIPLSE